MLYVASNNPGNSVVSPTLWASIQAMINLSVLKISTKNITRRNDFVSPYSYCGSAPTSSSESANVWTIYRIKCFVDGSVTILSATNVAWTDRLTVIYT